jgi:hypothetical protein
MQRANFQLPQANRHLASRRARPQVSAAAADPCRQTLPASLGSSAACLIRSAGGDPARAAYTFSRPAGFEGYMHQHPLGDP